MYTFLKKYRFCLGKVGSSGQQICNTRNFEGIFNNLQTVEPSKFYKGA